MQNMEVRDIVHEKACDINAYKREIMNKQWASILEIIAACEVLDVSAKICVSKTVYSIGANASSSRCVMLIGVHWVLCKKPMVQGGDKCSVKRVWHAREMNMGSD